MDKYEAEVRNMKHCYWVALLKNILLAILIVVSIYLTDNAWCLLALVFWSNCNYDDMREKKDE